MDPGPVEPAPVGGIGREFAFPLILASLPCFGLWLFLVSGMIANRIPGPSMISLPGSVSINTGGLAFAFLMAASFCGTLLLIARLRARSLPWWGAVPLACTTGFIAVCSLLAMVFLPAIPPGLQALPMMGAIPAFIFLPAAAWYLLRDRNAICGGISAFAVRSVGAIGLAGILILAAMVIVPVLSPAPPPSPYHDDFLNFSPAEAVLLLFCIAYGAILLPVAGLILLRQGLRCRFPEPGPG